MATNNPFAQPGQAQTPFNPFANMTASAPKPGSNIFNSSPNTIAPASATNPFAVPQSTKPNPFQKNNNSKQPKPAFEAATFQAPGKGNSHTKTGGFNPPPGPKNANSSAPRAFGTHTGPHQPNGSHGRKSEQFAKSRPAPKNGAQTKSTRPDPKAHMERPPSEFATRIYEQLAKDGIKAPQWPSDPTALQQKGVMDELRQGHRAYREKARKSLMKADLVDDPDKRRRLDQALPFKGICEDMCPEWERIQRITENGLWGPEGYEENGVRVPEPKKMIKRLARSAAGQEAALPMDVRSPAACKRTLDYLIDELIAFDDRLPTYHHFAWDRTRAIRIDLSMQTPSMTPDEMKDEIYCLETIVRFHATSAHLLARSWFKYKDYSEQQEVEQLSKSLMTLKQRYKDCADMGIVCDNEAEFLAYYIVFFGWDSSLKETVESWGEEISSSEAIQTAMCVVEAMQNTSMLHGPLKPESCTELALNAASIFFSIVASPQISYTMACIAEVHFGLVRQAILKTIVGSYSRPKGAPKDITPEFLRRQLRFDTADDAVAFAELHELEFKDENGTRYLFIEQRQQIKRPRVTQAFSHDIVERKRSERPFPEIIHETVYEISAVSSAADNNEEDSLFVNSPTETPVAAEDTVATDSDLEDTEAPIAPTSGTSIASNPFGTTNTLYPGFGVPSGSTIFSTAATGNEIAKSVPSAAGSDFGNVATSSPSSSKTQTSLFGSLSAPPSSVRTLESTDAGKKVTFGETSVKYIESREDTNSNAGTSSGSSGLFSLFSNNDSKTVSTNTDTKTGGSSWFPSSSAGSLSHDNKEGQSVLPGAIATPSTGFTFQTPSEAATGGAFGAAARSLSSPPSIHISQPDDVGVQHALNPGQVSAIFSSSSAPQSVTSSGFFSNAPAQQPNSLPAALPSQGIQTPGLFASAGTTPVARAQQPKKDKLDKFAKWFVCGDRGLLEDLQEWAVETLLRDVWDDFVKKEEERKRKEEDEKSWAEARKFRSYSLSVTYFYRWLEIFRKRRAVKRIRSERDKLRQWNAPETVAKREAANKDSKRRNHEEMVRLLQEKARGRAAEEDKFRQSTTSQDSVEQALLASGVFNGVRNPETVARQVAMNDEEAMGSSPLPSEMLYKQESRRREKHGLPPLSRLQQPRIYKEGSKAALLKAQLAGKDTLSVSTGSFRNSTLSSSFRSSLGFNSSRVSKIKKSRVSDPYWRMKANGLVQMPNGEYLHESLALPMLREGKRFPGLGDYGLAPSASGSPSASIAGDRLFEDSPPLMLEDLGRSRVSVSPSIMSNISSKRKRGSYNPGDLEDDDLSAYRREASASIHKRARSSGSLRNEPDLLAQMQSLLTDVQAEGKKLESR